MKMNSLDAVFYRRRCWEADFPGQSPEGKMRTLVMEAGKLGMSCRLYDRWDEDGRQVREELASESFWTPVSCTHDEADWKCLPENRIRVLSLLQALDGPSEYSISGQGVEEIEELFYLCFMEPHILSKEASWLKKYLPDFFKRYETKLLRDRETAVQSVLNT